MERDVRIGIVGCGGIANGKHMPSLQRVENAKMVAFVISSKNAQKRLLRNTARKAHGFIPIIKK